MRERASGPWRFFASPEGHGTAGASLRRSARSVDRHHSSRFSLRGIRQDPGHGYRWKVARAPTVRIDRFLFFIRLAKSRSLVQSVIDEGHVRIDGKRVEKASDQVQVGSVIGLPLRGKVRILRVLTLPDRRGPSSEARLHYEELGIDEGGGAS